MAAPLDLVNKHLQGLSQPNPLYDNNSSITINTANSLYNKYNSNPEVEDEEKSVYSQSDLIKKLQQNNSLAYSPTVETDSNVRYT